MKPPIFVLNAPAQTGKDTIANYFVDGASVLKTAFKDPMYEIFMATTGLNREEFYTLYETPGWKDSTQEITNGKTPRELMIHLSENFIKPFYGKDYFGKWVGEYIQRVERDAIGEEVVWVIPDSGFQGEYEALKALHDGRLILISLEREGKRDFAGDSRNWVFDFDLVEDEGAFHFDTTDGNEEVIKFMKECIGVSQRDY